MLPEVLPKTQLGAPRYVIVVIEAHNHVPTSLIVDCPVCAPTELCRVHGLRRRRRIGGAAESRK
jgi:hypothetical protein